MGATSRIFRGLESVQGFLPPTSQGRARRAKVRGLGFCRLDLEVRGPVFRCAGSWNLVSQSITALFLDLVSKSRDLGFRVEGLLEVL